SSRLTRPPLRSCAARAGPVLPSRIPHGSRKRPSPFADVGHDVLDAEGRALRSELFTHFARPITDPLPDDVFDDLARRIFTWQYERNEPYAAWCRRRGRTPVDVRHWHEIPAVPTAAFREIDLVAGRADAG